MMNKQESPEFVQTSLAGAMSLGLKRGRFYRDAYPGSLNLLLTYADGCLANCSYCGLARERRTAPEDNTFIRVRWPTCSLEEIIRILRNPSPAVSGSVRRLGRICLSMVTHPRAEADCCEIVRHLGNETTLPVSVLVSPTARENAGAFFSRLKNLGADRVGIAVDAATPKLFASLRGPAVGGPHRWETYWSAVEQAVEAFGENCVSVHLIVGLGETEQAIVSTMEKVQKYGAQAHLFAFCPEEGSPLSHVPQAPLGQYRRMQLAAYLLKHGIIDVNDIIFNSAGTIVDFGMALTDLLGEDLASGEPFMTSGCPDGSGCVACNRPYGNERPGPVLRNYPFAPTTDDISVIKGQIWHA